MLFSIIIPCYNVEAFLAECLDSVLSQSCTDWEAICVDDGSTDGTSAILADYAARDSRIHVLSQPNKRQAAARNFAMKYAHGDYVVMLDSDDVLFPGFLQQLHDDVEREQPDLIAINVEHWFPENDNLHVIDQQYSHPSSRQFASGRAYLEYFVGLKHWGPSGMFYVFRRSLQQQKGLWFCEGIYHEDDLFTPMLCFFAGKVMIDVELNYCYRMREGSTMHTRSLKNASDLQIVAEALSQFWKEQHWENAVSRSITFNEATLSLQSFRHLGLSVSLFSPLYHLAWRNATWKRKVRLIQLLIKK